MTIRLPLLAAALIILNASAQTRDTPVAMGNMGVHYNFRSVISTDDKPLTAVANGPIWCQATLNTIPLPIVSAVFVKYREPGRDPGRFHPKVDKEKLKASLQPEEIVHKHMGKYRCEIVISENDDHERTVYGNLFVYSSPFFHSNGSMNMVADEHNIYDVKAAPLYAVADQPMEVHCPAIGFPNPSITWFKNTEIIVPSDHFVVSRNGTLLTIDKFTVADEGKYTCTATNQYPNVLDIDFKAHEASLTQEVHIGSNYGWVWPLLVCLVILLLLFIIIYACAACRRFQHDQYNVAKREKLLRTPSPVSSAASTKKYELVSSA